MIKRIAIVGAGTLGTRIAYRISSRGFTTVLIDSSGEALDKARAFHARFDGGLPSLAYHDRLEAAAGADLVIDAIPERVDAKRALFAALEKIVDAKAILASNSSSIPVSQMEGALDRPDRLINMHFYMSVTQDPTIAEIMSGSAVDPAVMEAATDFLRAIGVVPLIVARESTGFIFNRIWRAIKREALTIASQSIATVEDIDRAWMIIQRQPLGPFAKMDAIGLDVTLNIERVYYAASGRDEDAPAQLLIDLVERGHLGVKTGRGFYAYPDPAFEHPDFLAAMPRC